MNPLVLSAAISALVTSAGLAGYHRYAARPAMPIGFVDVVEVYRSTETAVAAHLNGGQPDDDRQAALARANAFSRQLPIALDELAADCRCLVLFRTAVAGRPLGTVDLTDRLKAKLEAR